VTTPLEPAADDKDWTWVLERPCPECGLAASAISRDEIPDRVRAAVAALRSALAAPSATRRPEPRTWSALEYSCHVRDVCRVFGARLAAMRGTDDPVFADWQQDRTALADRYWEQHPDTVSTELAEEGARIAADFASVREEEWSRPGRRSNGSAFTVDTLARYFVHDLEHHVHDVTRI
jgi:hypothetical protein